MTNRSALLLAAVMIFACGLIIGGQQERLTPPSAATLPAHCAIGDLATKTTSTAGLYVCTATDTWAILGGGGGGGTPGGSNTQVQFNDSTAFGGNSGFTFTKGMGTGLVTLTGGGAGSFDGGAALIQLTATSSAYPIVFSNTNDPTFAHFTGVQLGADGTFSIDPDEPGGGAALVYHPAPLDTWAVGTTFQAAIYKSADGSTGATAATCSSFKNGLCVAP